MISTDTRVVVVDDDPSVRKGLGRLLKVAGFTTELYASAEEFQERSFLAGPSCLILDVNLPGLSGPELQQRLLASADCLPIIFITGSGDIPTSVQAIKAGALDFLIKPFGEVALLRAVGEALRRSREALAARTSAAQARQCFRSLTPREREILHQLNLGKVNKEIAIHLGIAEQTVKIHRSRVMHKMRARSLAELLRIVRPLEQIVAPRPQSPAPNKRSRKCT